MQPDDSIYSTDHVIGPTSRAFTRENDANISYGNRREILLNGSNELF